MTQADHIIGKFGGLSALARTLGHKHVSTVQGWKDSGFIPPRRHQAILDAAEAAGIDLKPSDFVQHLSETTSQPAEAAE